MLLPVISRLAEPPVGLFAKTAVVPPVEMLPNQHEHADHRAGGAHGLQSFDIDAEGSRIMQITKAMAHNAVPNVNTFRRSTRTGLGEGLRTLGR